MNAEIEKAIIEEGLEIKYKEYDFVPDASSLDIPTITESKIDETLEKAREGEILYLLGSHLLIKYLSENIEKNKEENEAKVLIFSKLKDKKNATNGYGDKKVKRIIKGKGDYLLINNKRIKHNFYPFKGEFEIYLGKDMIEEELYKKKANDLFNVSLTQIIMAKDSENTYGWEKVNYKTYSDPILALSSSIKKFKKIGGIILDNHYYPNPEEMINDSLILNIIENEKEEIKKLYYTARYENLKRLRNSMIYKMNFHGEVKNYNEKLKAKQRWMGKEVIIGDDIYKVIKEKIVKDLDYYEIEKIKIAKLATIIQALLSKGMQKELTLKYTENSINLKANLKKVLREVTLKKQDIGDIKIKYKQKERELEVSYFQAGESVEFLTLTEKYLIAKVRKGNLVVVF